jgi:hypothetical protein
MKPALGFTPELDHLSYFGLTPSNPYPGKKCGLKNEINPLNPKVEGISSGTKPCDSMG